MTAMHLDIYQTLLAGILALLLGMFLNRKIGFLRKVCIPAPVTGGIIFSLITLGLYALGVETTFDGTFKDICMVMFFTAVGYQCNFASIKQGGGPLLKMVLLVAVLIVLQNAVSIGIAFGMSLDPLVGMTAGSIPMCGGHGTAAGFSGMLEELGVKDAHTLTLAAATFGLLAGSLIGGPLSERLIRRRHLAEESAPGNGIVPVQQAPEASEQSMLLSTDSVSARSYAKALIELFVAMGLGTWISKLIALTQINVPSYTGALLAAVIIRNVSECIKGCPKVEVKSIVSVGNFSLSLFLGMAMVSLRLWELADMALPLLAMLCAQVVVMILFARFVAYPILGRTYDAAVLVGGICGFGLGATPNAMANMTAVCSKYRYSAMPFIVVPLVGAIFVDLINITVITLLLNIL